MFRTRLVVEHTGTLPHRCTSQSQTSETLPISVITEQLATATSCFEQMQTSHDQGPTKSEMPQNHTPATVAACGDTMTVISADHQHHTPASSNGMVKLSYQSIYVHLTGGVTEAEFLQTMQVGSDPFDNKKNITSNSIKSDKLCYLFLSYSSYRKNTNV